MTHQQRLQGVPAPNLTLVQSSFWILVLSMMTLMLLRSFPLPAIKEPVYASWSVEFSYMASLMAAVHCVRECRELKWNK